MAISIDPDTGLKIFDTRAAKASERIRGHGYEINPDVSLKTLPESPAGAKFDAVEQAKYREFKERRRGAADYMSMNGEFAKYLEDHYSSPSPPSSPHRDRFSAQRAGGVLRRKRP